MRRLLSTASLTAAVTACLATGTALAADLQVDANQAYFSGWSFNVSDNPRGCGQPDVIPSTGSITGKLGDLSYEVHALGASTSLPTNETNWVDCRWNYFGGNVPTGNNTPTLVDTNHVRAGNYLTTFSAPLPTGSLLLMQDFDGGEDTTVTFRSCSGAAIDASGFDWLQVSAPNASVVIPSHTAGATWRMVGDRGGSANETTAIVIRSNDVCQMETVNSKPGAPATGGRHFFYALPPTSLSVNIRTSGGPSSFSADYPLTLACTKDGADVSAGMTPASPVTVAAGSAAGAVLFNGIPVGAECTATQTQPAAPAGYHWTGAPAPAVLAIASASAGNTITLNNPLAQDVVDPPVVVAPTPVPTLGELSLALMALALGGLGFAVQRKRRVGQ